MSGSPLKKIKLTLATFASGEGLKGKVFRGGAWLGAGSFTEQTFRFVRNMLLTRLLAPEAFGTMAIILSTSSVLQSLTEVGVREALIQNPRGTEDEIVGAAWWLAFGRAIGFYLILFLTAPLIGKFYNNVDLSLLLRVATIGVLFDGAISTRAYVALKQMKFNRWAIANHGGGICGVVLTLILSYFIRGVWALVLGYCAESVFRCILSFIVCPYTPPLKWNRQAALELLRFSRGVFGLPVLNLIFIRADIFVLAKLYSSADIGFYSMAIYLIQTPVTFIMNLLGQTLMPTYAHIQDDKKRVNKILLQITTAIFVVGMPVIVFIYFSGHSLLTLVYGHRYTVGSGAFFLASIVALFNLANSQITLVFYAKGLPQLHRRSVALMAIIMVLLIYPFAKHFGLLGGQWAAIIAVVVGYLFQVERIREVTGLALSKYHRSFLLAGAVSLCAVLVCLAEKSLVSFSLPLGNIFWGILACLVAYAFAGAILLRNRTQAMLGL